MIKKVEKTIKGMNLFSAEDIAFILEAAPSKIEVLIDILEQQGKIAKVSNTTYSKIQKISEPVREKTPKKKQKIKPQVPEKKTLIKLKPREFKIKRITDLQGYEDYFFASQKTKLRIQKYIRLIKETQGMNITEVTEYINSRRYKISTETFLKTRRMIIKSGLKGLIPKGCKNIPPELYAFFKKLYLSPDNLTSKQARTEALKLFINKYPKCRLRQIPKAEVLNKKLRREYSKEDMYKYRMLDFSDFNLEELENA